MYACSNVTATSHIEVVVKGIGEAVWNLFFEQNGDRVSSRPLGDKGTDIFYRQSRQVASPWTFATDISIVLSEPRSASTITLSFRNREDSTTHPSHISDGSVIKFIKMPVGFRRQRAVCLLSHQQ